MLLSLYPPPGNNNNHDSLQLMDGKNKEYTVKSAYEKMYGICNGEQLPFFQSLWKVKVIPSEFFFSWRVMLKGVTIKVNLRRKKVLLNNYGHLRILTYTFGGAKIIHSKFVLLIQ